MALEFWQVTSIITAVSLAIGIGMFIIIIAGKDILLAVKRKINRYGIDIFIATDTKHIRKHYLTPEDGVVRINDTPYITNPDKILNVSDEAREEVLQHFPKDKRKKIITKAKEREDKIKDKIESVKKQKAKLKEEFHSVDEPNKQQIKSFRLQMDNLDKKIQNFEMALKPKASNYYKDSRPAFFFLENDPIPKDFHVDYSGIDAQMLDNVVSRAKTEAPQDMANWDKMLKRQQVLIYGLLAGLAFVGFMMFRVVTALRDAGVVDKII